MAFDAWGYSWGGPFTRFVRWGAFEQPTVPTFGPPFIDARAPILATLGMNSPLMANLSLRTIISPDAEFYGLLQPVEVTATVGHFRTVIGPEIEIQARFRSSRIDKDLS